MLVKSVEVEMFKQITVAYNESAESSRALLAAIQLTKSLGAELAAVMVMEELPSYIGYATATDPSLPLILQEDRRRHYGEVQDKVRALAQGHGVEVKLAVIGGPAVEAIVRFLRDNKTNLLVLGLHQRDLHIARLWSTVYELAQDSPCSVLGVH